MPKMGSVPVTTVASSSAIIASMAWVIACLAAVANLLNLPDSEWQVCTLGFYVQKLIVCKQKHTLFSIKLLLMFIQ